MRCYICNKEDDGIAWNSLHQDYNPCYTCQSVINEITYEKDDDEFIILDVEDVGC